MNNNNCDNNIKPCGHNNSFVIIVVLYILLAIIIGAWFY